MTSSMEEVLKFGQMALAMKVNTPTEKNKDMGSLTGRMEAATRGNFSQTRSTAWEPMNGLMVESTLANGKTMKCMAPGHSRGRMDVNM